MSVGLRIATIAVAVCLIAIIVYTTRLVLRFRRYVLDDLARPGPELAASDLPPAAVILALRGADPRLSDTLTALTNQDYGDYIVQIVVDNPHDPAMTLVEAAKQHAGGDRLRVSLLDAPSPSCSLKCSSLVQAIEGLDSRYSLLAFIDGDVVPHRTWLKELLAPLVRGEADATGGNRWYLPPRASWGAISRYFWNCAFLIVMWAQRAPWAGTMALRRDVIRKIGLIEAWRNAISVDATLHRLLTEHGCRFRLVPSLLMTNREDVALSTFFAWVTRQLAVARYAGPAAHGVTAFIGRMLLLFHLLIPSLAVWAIAIGRSIEAVALSVMLPIYWLASGVRSLIIEATVRRVIRRRAEDPRWFTFAKSCMWYPALVLTQIRMFSAVIRSLKLSQVTWRGITYDLSRDGHVRMQQYHPLARQSEVRGRDDSLL